MMKPLDVQRSELLDERLQLFSCPSFHPSSHDPDASASSAQRRGDWDTVGGDNMWYSPYTCATVPTPDIEVDMNLKRASKNDVQLIASTLSRRDWSILRFIRQHRYATTAQLRRRFFTQHTSQSAATRACVRVLGRLLTLRILSRLERRIGGVRHGSASFVWCLDVVGDRLTRAGGEPRWQPNEPSLQFLDHTLALTETHVLLNEAEAEGLFNLSEVLVESEASRNFMSSSGGKRFLRPDLKVTIGSGKYDDHWYLEIDRGTESVPMLLRKCRAYEVYRRTGRAQSEHGVFPRVLWVLPDTGRVERLREAIDADPDLLAKMFVCITADALIGTLRDPP